jgi:hypothetical protein
MKRSYTESNIPTISKKPRDSKDKAVAAEEQKQQDQEFTHSAQTQNSSMSVLRYVHDLVHNLEQGNIDRCLSNSIDTSQQDQLSKSDSELLSALDLNLKKIAHRQLQLETENLRCRIMIQQQHQLLTAHGHEDRPPDQEHRDLLKEKRGAGKQKRKQNNDNIITNNGNNKVNTDVDDNNKKNNKERDNDNVDDDDQQENDEITNGENDSNTTPEDNLTSVRDSSLLDKLENCYRQMSNEAPPTGYFGKV